MNLNLYKIPNVSTTFFAVRRIYEAFLEERKPFLARHDAGFARSIL